MFLLVSNFEKHGSASSKCMRPSSYYVWHENLNHDRTSIEIIGTKKNIRKTEIKIFIFQTCLCLF
jgi:hypothetical protein